MSFSPRPVLALLGLVPLASSAAGQTLFSIDNGSATIGTSDAFTATPITEGDLLTPSTGPAPGPNAPALSAPVPPGTSVNAGVDLGLSAYSGCVGHLPGTPCPVEVDALSFGADYPVSPGDVFSGTFMFSVDEVARGVPSTPPPYNVFSEGALSGAFEAAGDVFGDVGGAPGPLAPFAIPGGCFGAIDGNGFTSSSGALYPGLGLVEPGGLFPFVGDDVDALEVDTAALGYPVYFSLDSAGVDIVLGTPLQASAVAHGFVGGDVIVTLAAGGPPVLYAPATALGLDIVSGADSDDLDALALWENGTPGFQPAQTEYDWTSTGSLTDMLLFSVRRGSAVVGAPDSRFGVPIEEGDILGPPLPASSGGVSPYPSIWIAAENLGLQTARSFLAGGNTGDDLDALDSRQASSDDCNANGIPDALDIGSGLSTDYNANGIPDECELISSVFCECTASVAPCGNDYAPGGCENLTGLGAILTATGTGSVTLDNLFLDMVQLPPSNFGIIFMGPSPIAPVPFGNGLRCVGGNLFRFLPPFFSTPGGTASVGAMVGLSLSIPGGEITSGSTWNFQGWYRDPGGPCGENSNATNALSVTFTP